MRRARWPAPGPRAPVDSRAAQLRRWAARALVATLVLASIAVTLSVATRGALTGGEPTGLVRRQLRPTLPLGAPAEDGGGMLGDLPAADEGEGAPVVTAARVAQLQGLLEAATSRALAAEGACNASSALAARLSELQGLLDAVTTRAVAAEAAARASKDAHTSAAAQCARDAAECARVAAELPPRAASAALKGAPAAASREQDAASRDLDAAARAADPFAFGSAHDMSWHRGDSQCWEHFDFGFADAWQATAALFCAPLDGAAVNYSVAAPPSTTAAAAAVAGPAIAGGPPAVDAWSPNPSAGDSWLRCRVTVDGHLPGPTGPHTLCDGANVVLDTGRMSPTGCLASRPGYKCDGPPVHWAWAPGALGGACAPQPALGPGSFPNDHLKDMFAGWQPQPLAAAEVAAVPASDAPIVLLVARERQEHANAFHATTDFLNAFITLHVAGVIDGHSGSRAGMERVQVLLLDEQEGPFDGTYWRDVFSPAHPVLRISDLAGGARARLRLPRALFVPPGYTNMLLSHVASEGDCHAGTQLFQSYRRFVLAGLGVPLNDHHDGDGDAAQPLPPRLRVTFVSRRPYHAFVEHSFVGRQVDNEPELLAAMAALGSGCHATEAAGCDVQRVDFAAINATEQAALLAATDVLVGMHGAALTQALYLPPHAALLELWPKPGDMWRCFEHIAAMRGLTYARWANGAYPAGYRTDEAGDYTTVHLGEFGELFRETVATTRRRKLARHRPEKE